MFKGCSSLEELNLSNFNTKNVLEMDMMFHDCSSLEILNFPNFKVNSKTNILYMFKGCNLLEKNKKWGKIMKNSSCILI